MTVYIVEEKTGIPIHFGEVAEWSAHCFTTDTPEGPRYSGWRVSCTTSLEPKDLGFEGPPEVYTSTNDVALVWRGDPERKFMIIQALNLRDSDEVRQYAFVHAWIDTVRVQPGKPTEVALLAPERRM